MSVDLNWIAGFIWNIADDVLRDLYVRSKYRDVILPMTVLRRLDAVLEPTKDAVLEMKASLDKAGIDNQDMALRQASGQAFYNSSKFKLRDLKARASRQALKADFEAWLDGFSPNVQEIIDGFEFRNQLQRLSQADALGTLIERYLDPRVNLAPTPVLNGDGSVKLDGLDNHGMGTVFEELVRRFNAENNEEAGEHWTPRDAVKLMARLIFDPIADQIESGTYTLYDGACGTGGMLTVAEETLRDLAAQRGKQVSTHLYGQEINAETYAIAKADFLLHGDGEAADNLVGGPEHSTLSADAFPSREFDFMLSNPPYGKSWKNDAERMGGKGGIRDPRFVISHADEADYSLATRSSDGQMLFLANLISKMKSGTKLGSRIAEVHNGSSLFTGDAGQGESNIRRWVIENDWLEAIIALPLNLFYNTGIATYVWVLSNRKPKHRQGKVQLIDATTWSRPLRKNLGKKNCELSEDDIGRILAAFNAFEETEQSKIFDNAAFGYRKVTVERPLRVTGIDPDRAYGAAEIKAFKADGRVDLTGHPVIRRIHKAGKHEANPLAGVFARRIGGKECVVEYEPDPDLRDTEQVPLLEKGGVAAFIEREVLPHAADAWMNGEPKDAKLGSKVSGGDALTLRRKAKVSELPAICAEALTLYGAKEYESDFGWIDQIRHVRDTTTLGALRGNLVAAMNEALAAGDADDLHLAYPVIYDPDAAGWVRFRGYGTRTIYPDLELTHYLEGLKSAGIGAYDEQMLSSHTVQECDEAGQAAGTAWKVGDCIVFETEHDGRRYVLSAGRWYEIASDLAEAVTAFFEDIEQVALPDAEAGDNEETYNSRHAKSATDMVCLDRKLLKPTGAGSKIEVCDFFSDQRCFIHVKDKSASSRLSHLFSQGAVSALVFKTDKPLRKDLVDLVEAQPNGAAFAALLPKDGADVTAGDFTVVFGVLVNAAGGKDPKATRQAANRSTATR